VKSVRRLRRKLLGETWTIPLGVSCAVAVGATARALLPHAWLSVGGFALAAVLIATLIASLATDQSRVGHQHPTSPSTDNNRSHP
jgi:hypothetical protein